MGILSDADRTPLPPQPAGPYQAEGPAAPAIQGNPIEQAFADFEHADKFHARHLEAVNAIEKANRDNPTYTPEGVDGLRRSFGVTPAARGIEERMSAVNAYVAEAEAREEQLRESLRPGDDVASQVAAQRQWDRVKPVLDAADAGSVSATARRLIENATPAQLPVYAEELKPYLDGRQIPSNVIDEALAAKVPELAQAREHARQVRKQRDVLNFDHLKLRREIATGSRSGVKMVDPRKLDGSTYR